MARATSSAKGARAIEVLANGLRVSRGKFALWSFPLLSLGDLLQGNGYPSTAYAPGSAETEHHHQGTSFP